MPVLWSIFVTRPKGVARRRLGMREATVTPAQGFDILSLANIPSPLFKHQMVVGAKPVRVWAVRDCPQHSRITPAPQAAPPSLPAPLARCRGQGQDRRGGVQGVRGVPACFCNCDSETRASTWHFGLVLSTSFVLASLVALETQFVVVHFWNWHSRCHHDSRNRVVSRWYQIPSVFIIGSLKSHLCHCFVGWLCNTSEILAAALAHEREEDPEPVVDPPGPHIPDKPVGLGPAQPPPRLVFTPDLQAVITQLLGVLGGMQQPPALGNVGAHSHEFLTTSHERLNTFGLVEYRVADFIAYQLDGPVRHWWCTFIQTRLVRSPPESWDEFSKAFLAMFIPRGIRDRLRY
ncbi:hypothetical protein MTR67_044197 [Solanum verrucosum]|uniref:Retrotransposon gag domain-containing protein n=1 Tax=Solanum verrucosum TaxID=315347 RepID=A0AAF0UQT8_SOLVR|nr:hypothetical protein MTR67_044197 [Solanum verrucosum]